MWNRVFIGLLIINFFNSMGQMMMTTLIPLYAYNLGATATMVGIVTSSFAITALLCRPFVGPAFDSFSKKWMLFGAMAISVVAVFLYGQMTTVPGLIFARLLHGVAMSCTGPLAMALVCNAIPSERFGTGVSIYSLVGALCMAVGPAVGLWLVGVFSYTFVFTISAITLGIGCVLVVFLKDPNPSAREPYRFAPSRMFAKGAVLPAAITCILVLAATCVGSFIAIYAGLRGVENIGLYFTAYAITMLATRPLYGHLADKYGFQRVIIPGLALFAAAYVIIWQADSLPLFLLAGVVNGFGFGAVIPLMQALAVQCVPANHRGAASNTYYIGIDSGMLLGPAFGGLVVDLYVGGGVPEVFAYSNLYLTALIPIAVGIVLYLLTRKRMDALRDRVKLEDNASQND